MISFLGHKILQEPSVKSQLINPLSSGFRVLLKCRGEKWGKRIIRLHEHLHSTVMEALLTDRAEKWAPVPFWRWICRDRSSAPPPPVLVYCSVLLSPPPSTLRYSSETFLPHHVWIQTAKCQSDGDLLGNSVLIFLRLRLISRGAACLTVDGTFACCSVSVLSVWENDDCFRVLNCLSNSENSAKTHKPIQRRSCRGAATAS